MPRVASQPVCHPERTHKGNGLCVRCYDRKWKQLPYVKQRDKAYRERTKEQAKCRSYRSHLKHTYGMSPDDYDTLLVRQGGVCAICSKPPVEGARLAIDHDHVTGKIRGLLHKRCNLLLGYAGDSVDVLHAAILYLQTS